MHFLISLIIFSAYGTITGSQSNSNYVSPGLVSEKDKSRAVWGPTLDYNQEQVTRTESTDRLRVLS